jgi:hypothetical protein
MSQKDRVGGVRGRRSLDQRVERLPRFELSAVVKRQRKER